MVYGDLTETKRMLDIDQDNRAEDGKLLILIEQASRIIDEFLGRQAPELKSRTEYYNGTGTQKLLLRQRPVFTSPLPQVFRDETGYWGSSSGSFDPVTSPLVYGDDFALQLDQEDGSSRSGILYRISGIWEKPSVRMRGFLSPFIGPSAGNIKVVYTAGYTMDNLPSPIRFACNLLVARMRHLFPWGLETTSENYSEVSYGSVGARKDFLMALVKDHLFQFRNWTF